MEESNHLDINSKPVVFKEKQVLDEDLVPTEIGL